MRWPEAESRRTDSRKLLLGEDRGAKRSHGQSIGRDRLAVVSFDIRMTRRVASGVCVGLALNDKLSRDV